MIDKKLISFWATVTPMRFLIVGGWNFVFGYGVFVGLYWLMNESWPDWLITSTAAILGITMSFLSHRCITYRSHGSWWREYLRFYAVYGGQTLLNIFLIWLFVTRLEYNAYFVQLIITLALTIASYWAHKLYSFRSNGL